MNKEKDAPVFPILRGESVSIAGDFSGRVVIICNPEDLKRKLALDSIPVLHHDLDSYFNKNPDELDRLLDQVKIIVAEFGESISQFATHATKHGVIALVKVNDATFVLESDMHIRIRASENQGDIFFID